MTAEREPTPRECEILGCFRQGFQCLRESIRDGKELHTVVPEPETQASRDHEWKAKTPPYIAFKALAGHVAHLLSAGSRAPGHPAKSYEALRLITANRWREEWVSHTYELLYLDRDGTPDRQPVGAEEAEDPLRRS